MFRPDRRGLQIFSLVLMFLPPPMRWVKESSLRTGKLIISCSRSLRLPSGGCLAGARLDSIGEAGFEGKQNVLLSFLKPKA